MTYAVITMFSKRFYDVLYWICVAFVLLSFLVASQSAKANEYPGYMDLSTFRTIAETKVEGTANISSAYLSGMRDGINWMVYFTETEADTNCISKVQTPQLIAQLIADSYDHPETPLGLWAVAQLSERCPSASPGFVPE
jgi:hypothetical protein